MTSRAILNGWPIVSGNYVPPPLPLSRFSQAKALVASGVRNGRIIIMSDSTGVGYGAGGATWGNDLRLKGWVALLSGYVSQSSIESWFGNGDAGAANRYSGPGGADSRLNSGSWGLGGGSKIGLGQYPYLATAAGAPFTFTPRKPFDTIEIFYLTDPTNGVGAYSYDVLDNGVSIGQINGSQPEGFRRATFSLPLGNHTISCNWLNGPCYLSGMIASRSDTKEMQIINCSVAGGKVGDVVAPSSAARLYSPLNSLGLLQPDLVIHPLVINDCNTGTPLTTFETQTRTADARYVALGADRIYGNGAPSNPAVRASDAQQIQYSDVVRGIAYAARVPFADVRARLGTFAEANSRGWMIDDVHQNAAGYAQTIEVFAPPVVNA